MGELKDRIALVTGGSRGIGRGIAVALARAGASVALSFRQRGEDAERVVGEIEQQGNRAIALQLEVSDRGGVRTSLAQIQEQLGAVDILVNNAGMAQEKPFDQIADDDWDRMLVVNLRGPFACCQECLPGMIERGFGRIINISSIGGQWGGFNQVHYAAAKAGLISLTRSMAKIYSAHGVTTNAIAPGLVATELTARELASEAGQAKVKAIPAGRLGEVDDIGQAVVFLASDAAGYITGQTLNLNGGMYFG